MANEHLTEGTALAGGLVAVSLLDTLVSKGVLTLPDARDVLRSALQRLAPHNQMPGGFEASRIITDIMRNRFPEDRK